MLEVMTRQFRVEKDELNLPAKTYLDWIRRQPGYISGSLREYNGDCRADFAVKVI